DTKATPITGIELDQPSKEMSEGETVQLNILISPTNTTDDKTVTCRTSNSSVATVDKNGLVTATGSGACKIYAYVGDYRAICTLKINKATTVTVKFDADNGEDPVEKQVIKDYEALNYTPKSPTKKGYTFVGWYKNTDDITTEYKQGTRFIQSVTYKAKWAHVTMLGAQVKSVINGNSGIRFGTNIYNDGDEIVEKGTLIIPANLLSEGEALTLDNTKAAKSMGKVNYETNKEENYVIYLGTIVNIPKAQFDRQMTAASYVTYQDKAGNEYTVYSPYTNGSVSVNDLLGKTDE
ncbi:MAG: Ig domain-containing protein, partial [Intestinibacter sp.]